MIDATLWARKCEVTGEPMSEGYLVYDDVTIKEEKDLIEYLRKADPDMWEGVSDDFVLENAYDEEYFWTSWEDPSDMQYLEVNGKLYEIELD